MSDNNNPLDFLIGFAFTFVSGMVVGLLMRQKPERRFPVVTLNESDQTIVREEDES